MKPKLIKRLVSIPVAIAMLGFFLIADPFWLFEYRTQDSVFQQLGVTHPDIMLIGIDEHTLDTFGSFADWNRPLIAEAINILNSDPDFGPTVIGVDVLYSEIGADPLADQALVEAVRNAGNVVLAARAHVGFDREALSLDLTIVNVQRPFDALLPYVEIGLVNGITDRDGVIRNAPLWTYFRDERINSFAVSIAKIHNNGVIPEFAINYPETYIRYTGLPGHPGDFFMFSFADIFEPYFDPAWLDGAIVLIGPYADGMMDFHLVPIGDGDPMHGVEIHANVLQVILDDTFKIRPPAVIYALLTGALIVIGMALVEFLGIKISIPLYFVLALSYYFLVVQMFNMGYILPIFNPLLALGLTFVYQLSYTYILHTIERNHMRNVFRKYVDPSLVDILIEEGAAEQNEVGRRKHIAVLFVDVRGFTPLTEKMRDTPELIVETLNEYLELTSSAIFNNGGSVDKFIGDATMALFNGFVPLEDYVYKSVKAAWEMTLRSEEVSKSIKEKFDIDMSFGIGVHCGEAIVGNLGPTFRKDYTAIGDTVNTAARLESIASRSQVLISKDIYDLLEGRISAESIGEIPLKGKSIPLEIFSLTGVHE